MARKRYFTMEEVIQDLAMNSDSEIEPEDDFFFFFARW